jgi:hypothetical protein
MFQWGKLTMFGNEKSDVHTLTNMYKLLAQHNFNVKHGKIKRQSAIAEDN